MSKGVVIGGLNSGGGSSVKSIQRGTYAFLGTTKDITINSVDINKSIVKITFTGDAGNPANYSLVLGKLTSSTILNLSSVIASGTFNVSWEVIEFDNIKSLQKGEVIQTDTVATQPTISPVNVGKSFIVSSFKSSNSTNNIVVAGLSEYSIINNTTISFLNRVTGTKTFYWYVVEFN